MALRLAVNDREIDATLAGVCGVYCGACPVHRAWAEQDFAKLRSLAASLGTTTDKLMCTGCRTPAAFCLGGDCEIKACAQARGVAFCPSCADYPCERIERFEAGAPYRAAMRAGADRLRDAGVSVWLREQDALWRCRRCGAKTVAGSDSCPSCGHPLSGE